MIKKTIITACVLLAIYSIFVVWFIPKWSVSQHQWQGNIIKAQHFIYDDNDYKNVIVGSSLSCRLIVDSLPQTYNLSFGGQSIFDGLNILTHADKLPENVFIEMNVVLRKESKNFTSSLYSIFYYPKKKIPSLREDKQPVGVIGFIVIMIEYKIIKYIKESFPQSTQTNSRNNDLLPKTDTGNNDLFSKLLRLQIKDYSALPDESVINESFDHLKVYISELEKKNVNIVFFEMPVNYQLINLAQAVSIRKTFYERFPESNYHYISMPDSLKFITTDGVHLSGDEGLKYTMYFKTKMNNYIYSK